MRFRHRLIVLAQALDVKPDRLADLTDSLLPRSPSRNATGQVRNVRGVVPRRFLNNDGVLHVRHSVSPACFMTLAHVPSGRSSPGFPAIVTVPGLLGCRYWRWLPLVRINDHPSCSTRRIASRTLGISSDRATHATLRCACGEQLPVADRQVPGRISRAAAGPRGVAVRAAPAPEPGGDRGGGRRAGGWVGDRSRPVAVGCLPRCPQ